MESPPLQAVLGSPPLGSSFYLLCWVTTPGFCLSLTHLETLGRATVCGKHSVHAGLKGFCDDCYQRFVGYEDLGLHYYSISVTHWELYETDTVNPILGGGETEAQGGEPTV